MEPLKTQKAWVDWLIAHESQVKEIKARFFERGLRDSIMMKEMVDFSSRLGKHLGQCGISCHWNSSTDLESPQE